MQPKITVIIPNYNNINLLDDLLVSLSGVKTPYELIIVDDCSSDDSVMFLKEHYPDVKLLVNSENHGFAYTVNRGIKIAETPYVYLLNNDTTVTPDFLDEPLKIHEANLNVFGVSSKMLQIPNHDLIEDAGDEYNIIGWSKKRGYNKPASMYTSSGEVFSACAGAAMYKRELFDKVGYFDENFGSYVEDMDLSFRARLHGYINYYASNSIVYHVGSAATGSVHNSFKVENSARNNVYLIYKNMPTWMKVVNFIFIILGILIKYLYFKCKGLGKYYIKGIHDAQKTKGNLTKTTSTSAINYLKIEYELIKNTLRYLK